MLVPASAVVIYPSVIFDMWFIHDLLPNSCICNNYEFEILEKPTLPYEEKKLLQDKKPATSN